MDRATRGGGRGRARGRGDDRGGGRGRGSSDRGGSERDSSERGGGTDRGGYAPRGDRERGDHGASGSFRGSFGNWRDDSDRGRGGGGGGFRGDGDRGRGRGGFRGDGDRGRGGGGYRGDGDRGRGGGGYRGDGDRGRGGGGYRGDGDRGRGGGGYRGDGDRGRGGGGYRGDGDRGRGGGGYRGDGDRGRGGGGYRGDGGGRGGFRGRGGRGGGRAESPGKSRAFSIPGGVPTPDPEITKLEDKLVANASLNTQMSKLSVKGKSGKAQPALPALLSDIFPARPAFGSKGREIVVWANYFRVDVNPDLFYKYTVDVKEVIDPEKLTKKGSKPGQPKEVRGRKLQLVIKELLSYLWTLDNSLIVATEFKDKLITLKKLPLTQNPVRIEFKEDAESDRVFSFDVTINGPTEANVEDLKKYLTSMHDDPQGPVFPRYPDIIDALNVIFGYGPRWKMDQITAVGSSRFFSFTEDKVIKELTHNWRAVTAMRGYFQSTRIGTGRLLLNTNVTHGVFRLAGPLKKIFDNLQISPVQKSDGRGLRMVKAFSRFLPKARVRATFKLANGKEVKRVKTIHSLASSSDARRGGGPHYPKFTQGWEYPGPKHIQFWLTDDNGGGKFISIFEYYRHKYGANLGDYPVLNLGTADKPTYFPAEFLELEAGQAIKASLTMDETTAMLEFACRSPYSNALSISTESRKVLGLDEELLGDFGISVAKNLLTVQARILGAPMVSYMSMDGRQKRDIAPQNGTWNMRQVRVFKPGKMIERWTWVNLLIRGNEEPVDGSVVNEFGKFLNQNMGIAIARSPISPPTVKIRRDDTETLESFFGWLKSNGIQLVVVILSDKDSSGLYAKVKTLGDCTYGVHTSCVVAKQFQKAHPAYFANVGLKVNLKGGGVNHKLKDEFGLLREGKTMFVGYDVTHPTSLAAAKPNWGPGKPIEPPSLVGLVASIDRDLGQWPALAWEQASRQEMLDDTLKEAFMSRLELWQKHNSGNFPENIVIFRDGVSEGQFAQVINQELTSIREACRRKCPPKFQPKITIVVSVKRHHTRFYPSSTQEMSNSGNIKNGTIVDRGVTQVRYWDFFLAAHDALQGTTRPAHYTVLLDEIFRSRYGSEASNELERLTHELCYTYGRATKAVSICPPAYYADIVCERARAHRPEWFDVSDTESVTTAGGTAPTILPGGRMVHDALRDSMYYI
ncbi:Argonaute RISC catalytic component 2-like protein [Cladobotryum mycophilum]|uniref:Argonaute RISC catalytic component 2-like protein n=1 Tax=Cladobotryum mycophilum TaxID=491253 RepID=A0ABR0SS57_9HYPO